MDRNSSFDRENVRVAVFFPVKWKPAENSDDLKALIQSHRTSDRFTAPPTAFSDLPSGLVDLTEFQETAPHIYTMWMTMERKLDHIIWLLNRQSFDDDGMEEGVCVNLSAGGASVRTKRKLAEGEMIHLRMTPPAFPLFLVEVLGQAVASEPDEQKEGEWVSRLGFAAINKTDKEDLITFIFKRQREILRENAD